MKECIVDALRKAKGGNCSRSYSSLAKVLTLNLTLTITLTLNITLTNFYRLQETGATVVPSSTGCSQSQTIVCTQKGLDLALRKRTG